MGRLTLTMGQQLCDELGRPLTRRAAKLHVDRIDADWQGAPRYRGYAVITHRTAPLYLPVTRERWLRHKLVEARGAAKTQAPKLSQVTRDSIEWAQRLASEAPELHGGVRDGRIVASGLAQKGESGDPLVSVHPDLYDRRHPAAVQIVSYKTSDAGIKNFPTIQRIAAALREKVTVPMLEALLDGR